MNMNILVFDTETTGLPEWHLPSNRKCQPHVVQIGAVLCDFESKEIIDELDVIVRPDDWEISDEMSEIHGITTGVALDTGIPEVVAVQMLLNLSVDTTRVSHNRTFDQRIIRIALSRYYKKPYRDKWAEKDDYECTMNMCGKFGCKTKKLADAYRHFTGKELEHAHSAISDAKACMEIYFAMTRPDLH